MILRSKSLWVVLCILSFVSFVAAFPVLLFTFYPFSIPALVLYLAIVILSVFCCRQKTAGIAQKRWLFSVLLVPIMVLILILISIEAGWIHFPG